MRAVHAGRVLPGVNDLRNDLVHGNAMFYLGKDKWTVAAHPLRITLHHAQVSAHSGSQTGLVNDQ